MLDLGDDFEGGGTTMTGMRRWLSWLAVAVVVLGFVNFFWFMAASSALGGDALNGHVTDGHYYVASHGTYTEVSESAWTANRIHAMITMASWPIVILTMVLYQYLLRFPSKLVGGAPGDSADRVARIRSSGSPVWSGTIRADAGGFNPTVGLLDAAVHPGGLIVRPKLAAPSAVLADEIDSVQLGRRLVAPTIEIDHAGVDLVSPLVLYADANSAPVQAIQWLASGPNRPPSPVIHPIAAWGAPASGPTARSEPRQTPPPRSSVPARSSVEPLDVLGLVVGVGLVVAGIASISGSGLLGVAWTVVAGAILVANTMRLTRRRRW